MTTERQHPAPSWPWADAAATSAARPEPRSSRHYPMTMYGIRERQPGPRWQALFDATWPAYRAWFHSEGVDARPDLASSRAMLQRHMPELVGTWERLVGLARDDEDAARLLTLWCPPRFLPGCSQAVLAGPEPVLVRNYDYSPRLFEQVCYSSRFTGRTVIGTGDCLWGLLDGMNADGLVVSLAFGGRPGTGPGFGIPLVVRYLLECASTVAEARAILDRVPVSMSYNLTMADTEGASGTAFVAPGCGAEFTAAPAATNHRGTRPEHPEHARSLRSVERLGRVTDLLEHRTGEDGVIASFLQPPLYGVEYDRAFGTLYTAVYRPAQGTVEYRWPGEVWRRSFDSVDATKSITLCGT